MYVRRVVKWEEEKEEEEGGVEEKEEVEEEVWGGDGVGGGGGRGLLTIPDPDFIRIGTPKSFPCLPNCGSPHTIVIRHISLNTSDGELIHKQQLNRLI